MKGQVILILLLVMTVGLAIGLSVIQRSLSDVSTASKVEQSSRAFSAAEAGIERALQPGSNCGTNCVNFNENSAQATVQDNGRVPAIALRGQQQDALEYPPISKETVAQFWVADPNSVSIPTTSSYTGLPVNTIDVYWGNSTTDQAAIEITSIYYSGGQYLNQKNFYDSAISRISQNGFSSPTLIPSTSIRTTTGIIQSFSYGTRVPIPPNTIMIRTRFLYTSTDQPIAVRGVGTCGLACSIPPQARIILSSGTAGSAERKIQFFSLDKVLPPYLDFAIFSTGDISK